PRRTCRAPASCGRSGAPRARGAAGSERWRPGVPRSSARVASPCPDRSSGRRNQLDPEAGRLDVVQLAALLHDERLGAAVRRQEEVAKLPELAPPAHDGAAEEPTQRSGSAL